MTLDFSFKDLADVAAQGNAGPGRPRLIAIDSIDEDADQPRRNFGEQELDELFPVDSRARRAATLSASSFR